jgi:hypothetical protein
MQKTYSQKAARVFEIINYLLLIPTTYLLVLANFHPVILAIYCTGCLWQLGFILHSRNKLSANSSKVLWIGTLAYNLPPFLVILYAVFWILYFGFRTFIFFNGQSSDLRLLSETSPFYLVPGLYFGAVVYCSFKSLLDVNKNYQKYR